MPCPFYDVYLTRQTPHLVQLDPQALKGNLFSYFFDKADLEAAIALTSEQYVSIFHLIASDPAKLC